MPTRTFRSGLVDAVQVEAWRGSPAGHGMVGAAESTSGHTNSIPRFTRVGRAECRAPVVKSLPGRCAATS